jgi:hypothetical protein
MATKSGTKMKRRDYRKRVNKPRSAKEMLKILRDFMKSGANYTEEQRKVWDVITALRGPDESIKRYHDKAASTTVLRYALLGDSTAAFGYADIYSDHNERAKHRQQMETVDDHFGHHIRLGFKGLGLDWECANRIPLSGIDLDKK